MRFFPSMPVFFMISALFPVLSDLTNVPRAHAGETDVPGEKNCETPLQLPVSYLPPSSQRLVIGLLAELESGEEALALQSYLGSHGALERALAARFGRVRTIRWGGEILLANSSDQIDRGTVLRINATSKHVQGKGIASRNDIVHQFLLQRQIELPVSDSAELIPFAQGNHHLYAPWNPFPGDFRHELLNNLLMLSIRGAFTAKPDDRNSYTCAHLRSDPQCLETTGIFIEAMMRTLDDPSVNYAIQNDGFELRSSLERLREYLEPLRRDQQISRENMKSLQTQAKLSHQLLSQAQQAAYYSEVEVIKVKPSAPPAP